MMNQNTAIKWWNSLNNEWKEIIQINYSGQFEMGMTTRVKLFKQGINPVDNYKIQFGEDFILFDVGETFFKNLPGLKFLYAAYSGLDNISPLGDLVLLEVIDVSFNNISSIEPIKNMINIKEFYIEKNQLENLEFLNNKENLEILNLRYNHIEQLNGLEKLVNIKALDVGINRLGDLNSLKNLIKLEKLVCDVNNLNEIDFFLGLETIIYIDAKYNKIASFSLSKLSKSIKYLNLQNNPVKIDLVEQDMMKMNGIELIL
jgi:Leucine-rich repeat (LRR) protein